MRQATIDLLHVIPLNAGNICDPDASVSRPPKSLNLFLKSHFTTRVARHQFLVSSDAEDRKSHFLIEVVFVF